jgi:hypothetical protein
MNMSLPDTYSNRYVHETRFCGHVGINKASFMMFSAMFGVTWRECFRVATNM